MVKLKLDVVVGNLNKIKVTMEKAFEKNAKKSKGGAGAVAIGASVSIFTQLLKSTQSIVSLLDIIGSMINQLVAPFVPILLGLIKPVFILLQKFLLGALSSFGATGFGASGENVSTAETIVKVILATITAALGVVVSAMAGVGIGAALAIGAALFFVVPLLIDFGKWLGEKLFEFGFWMGEKLFEFGFWLGEKLFEFVDWLGDKLSDVGEWIAEVWTVFIDWLGGFFSETKDKIMGVVDILLDILKSAWDGIKSIWEWLLSALKSGIQSFANLFIDGLNALIKLLNKVPGVDIGTIGNFGGGNNLQTTIQVNIEGNTDESTVDNMLRALRREQQKRGTGGF